MSARDRDRLKVVHEVGKGRLTLAATPKSYAIVFSLRYIVCCSQADSRPADE